MLKYMYILSGYNSHIFSRAMNISIIYPIRITFREKKSTFFNKQNKKIVRTKYISAVQIT